MSVTLANISKTFNKDNPTEVRALQRIDLKIEDKAFLVIVGANGSGKSTLLNCLAGSFKPDTGDIYIDENNITRLSDYKRSQWIARIFQNPLQGSASELSILDNCRLASLRTQRKGLKLGVSQKFRQRVQDKIALLGMGLEDKLDQAMGTLSGGQRQALTLIMAIMDDAKILLLDEPTAALDPKSAKNIMQKADAIIKEFQLTALLVTHQLKDAHTYGNRIIQMQSGEIIKDLGKKEKQSLSLSDLFEWFS